MTGRLRWAATCLALSLSACSTTAPTRYLTLAAMPLERPAFDGAGLVMRPPEVHWPAAFDRLEVARPSGGVEVTVEELARWSAAPGRLAANALTADLAVRLPGAAIAPWTDPAPADAVVVTVQMETINEQASGYRMMAVVSTTRGQGLARRWTFQSEAAAPHGAEGEAQAVSRLLGQIADQIAGELAMGLSAPPAAPGSTASPRPTP